MTMNNVFDKIENAAEEAALNSDRKRYTSPKLTIYGDVSEITLKKKGLRDHNQSDSNDMGS